MTAWGLAAYQFADSYWLDEHQCLVWFGICGSPSLKLQINHTRGRQEAVPRNSKACPRSWLALGNDVIPWHSMILSSGLCYDAWHSSFASHRMFLSSAPALLPGTPCASQLRLQGPSHAFFFMVRDPWSGRCWQDFNVVLEC